MGEVNIKITLDIMVTRMHSLKTKILTINVSAGVITMVRAIRHVYNRKVE